MKSLILHAAKDLRIQEQPIPDCGPGQVQIRMETGGICGSDLHYFNHGGFGAVKLREPMILGHEVAGKITAIGSGVTGLGVGTRVAVSPSRPCGRCRFCTTGRQNHCLDMRFYGSAMPFPHIQGAFRQVLIAEASQCVPTTIASGLAAMAEPLSVVLHAASQAGNLAGQRVLVTGCGPIGLLAVLVSKAAGALEVVATDIADFALTKAQEVGADRVINVAENPDGLAAFCDNKGEIDIQFECSGVAAALSSAVPALRPGGTIVQLGLGGDMTLPVQALTAKELTLKGSFRFHHEFPKAIALMERGQIDLRPLITDTFALKDAKAAFERASDRSRAIKVQMDFTAP